MCKAAKQRSREVAMKVNLYEGQNVRHKTRAEWGIEKVLNIDSCGKIKVLFKKTMQVSIAKGANHLTKADKKES